MKIIDAIPCPNDEVHAAHRYIAEEDRHWTRYQHCMGVEESEE